AGGVEIMSRTPFMADAADFYTDASFPKRSRYIPVVLSADRLAEAEGVTREAMDAAALASQVRAREAEATPALVRSRIPVGGLAAEECPRAQTTAESLAAMEPAFAALAQTYADALEGPIDHRHTLEHAPPVCDGAALALLGGRPEN